MSVFNRAPQNTNLLQPTKFLLTFSRMPAVQYFCQSVNLPGVSLGEVVRVTPFLDQYSPGTKLSYNQLDVSFTIDEEMESWKNMYDWFISIAGPDGFDDRKSDTNNRVNKHFSDATLTVLNALNNPVIRIQYTNVFPLSMSDIQFDTTLSAETIITATANFRYESYKYLTL